MYQQQCDHLERFESMPDGWRIDKSWGSPEHGWIPICNGKSVLNGGRKGLLKLSTVTSREQPLLDFVWPDKRREPELSTAEKQVAAATTNQIARAQMKERLLKDLLFDLQVCRIEGWCCKQYVTELKELIDDAYQRVVG